MTLPSFLGIGAMRSGTTWLDQMLRSHADIYMSERRKEVHFFDQYYDRGLSWYEDFSLLLRIISAIKQSGKSPQNICLSRSFHHGLKRYCRTASLF